MRRFATIALCLLLPHTALADAVLQQHKSDTSSPLPTIIAALQDQLSPNVMLQHSAGAATLSYAGTATPPGLLRFLAAAFPGLETDPLLSGSPVSLSVAFTPNPNGTEMSLLIEAAFTRRSLGYPEGSTVLLDGKIGACAGQAVLSHDAPVSTTAPLYREYLRNNGFALQDDPWASVSFSSGYRPGCSVFLYLQDDTPGQSLIVLRFLED